MPWVKFNFSLRKITKFNTNYHPLFNRYPCRIGNGFSTIYKNLCKFMLIDREFPTMFCLSMNEIENWKMQTTIFELVYSLPTNINIEMKWISLQPNKAKISNAQSIRENINNNLIINRNQNTPTNYYKLYNVCNY